MKTALHSGVAFHLTGRREPSAMRDVDVAELRPALLAGYRDLTALRFDFPVVLSGSGGTLAEPLSGACDRVLEEIAHGDDGDRVSRHVLRLEREIRRAVAAGATGSLSTLWAAAADRMGATRDELLADSLSRAAAALHLDGPVLDCDADLPSAFFTHAWSLVQTRKAGAFRRDVDALVRRLRDIHRADAIYSSAGCRPERLRAALGGADLDAFDFDALSKVLATAAPEATIPARRRQRIEAVLETLESQDLYPPSNCTASRPSAVLAASRARATKVSAMVRALAIAELEATQAYREDRHDALFASGTLLPIDAGDLAMFPDYFVSVNARDLDPIEQAALLELLAGSVPVKILLQWDDILEGGSNGDGPLALNRRIRQLASLAMSGESFVMQAPASLLYQMRELVMAGMAFHGPALFSVYSGSGARTGGLPPYLVASAALEARAFPAFVYNPAAGPEWASRLSIGDNPQVHLDWPVQTVQVEDARQQRVTESLAFTVADFIACDARGTRHLALLPDGGVPEDIVPVETAVTAPLSGVPGPVPAIRMVDRTQTLRTAIVDEVLLREARRCREHWQALRALAAAGRPPEPTSPEPIPETPAPVHAIDTPAHDAHAAVTAPGDPYIETARCSTCNECTRINNRMFAYNENRQAYIKDPDAGSFAQLVEAAESCQLSIIHPGKPRNPLEPGLDELVARAQAFQ